MSEQLTVGEVLEALKNVPPQRKISVVVGYEGTFHTETAQATSIAVGDGVSDGDVWIGGFNA